ncbi:MAG: AMP-binding protein [Acidimicrobiales bacterium]
MTEPGSEVIASVAAEDNVLQALRDRASDDGAATALMVCEGEDLSRLSVSDMLDEVRQLAAGLVGAGVQVGDRVAIFSHARLEWALLDYAIWHAGAVNVTIYETSSADQVEWILLNSGATAAIVENDELAAKVESVREATPALARVFTIESDGLDELRALGASIDPDELDARASTIHHDDPATLVYSSGTTGRPKGCVLTHLNLIWTIRQVEISMPELVTPGNRTLTFLPLAHILARVVQLAAISAGVPVTFGGGVRTLLGDLATVKPTWLTVVPRVLEKVHDGVAQKAGTGVKRYLFDQAAKVARDVGAHKAAGTTPPFPLQLAHKAADALVLGSLRTAMGASSGS